MKTLPKKSFWKKTLQRQRVAGWLVKRTVKRDLHRLKQFPTDVKRRLRQVANAQVYRIVNRANEADLNRAHALRSLRGAKQMQQFFREELESQEKKSPQNLEREAFLKSRLAFWINEEKLERKDWNKQRRKLFRAREALPKAQRQRKWGWRASLRYWSASAKAKQRLKERQFKKRKES